ncbi:MAG: protoglobin domain-containing protein [Polyangiaceae bacterium]|nr:protoglobin domain-containing protein [Polyangiaceae bacterium]
MDPAIIKLFDRMKSFLDFSHADVERLVALQPIIEKHGPGITNRFYERLSKFSETAKFIEGRVDELRVAHVAWLRSLVGGVYDENYLASRWKIGVTHVRIGLDPYWVEGVMSFIRTAVLAAVTAEMRGDPTNAGRHAASFLKACDLDIFIINLSYAEDRLDRLASFTGVKRSLIETIIRIPKK